jgi:two-component system sensor histidine kinase AlgZ
LIASTWLALLQPRRAIPILMLVGPLIYAQWTFGAGGWIPAAVGAFMCLTFVLVGPLAWRAFFPLGTSVRWWPLRLLLFALVGAVCVYVTGEVIPTLLLMGPSMLTAPTESHFVTTAMFWVGGWGLGRDIDLELTLEDERERAEALAREAERAQLMALRSHLDPHFLFNTLNAIAEWCREDGEVAERAVLELSQVLRTVLSGVKISTWSLDKELELLQLVFSLHLLRDPSLFQLEVDVDDDARSAVIPTMILLPLAENAMKHGPAAGHRGVVRVAASLDGETLLATIENPGAYTGRREGGEGIAMVESRIALATDDEGVLEIGPADDPERTRARVRLPLDLVAEAA